MSLLATAWCGGVVYGDEIDLADKVKSALDEPGHQVQTDIKFGSDLSVPAIVEATDQGNGILSLPGLTLKIWDEHDDGLIYARNPLRLDAAHFADPKSFDLVVTGIARHTGEKETDPSWDEAILFVYRLDCESGKFNKLFSVNKFDINLSAGSGTRFRCK